MNNTNTLPGLQISHLLDSFLGTALGDAFLGVLLKNANITPSLLHSLAPADNFFFWAGYEIADEIAYTILNSMAFAQANLLETEIHRPPQNGDLT